MKTKTKLGSELRRLSLRQIAVGVVAAILLLSASVHGAGVVTNCTEANLRAAMAGGGLVTFACDGTIALSSTITNNLDVTFDGAGHNVILSGSNTVRVFFVASNTTVAFKNLKIANGFSTKGAGIFNDGGTLALSGVLMAGNFALNYAEMDGRFVIAEGGAIFNRGGTVRADTCTFFSNVVFQASDDFASTELKSRGGAVRNLNGVVTLQDCLFTINRASGGQTMGPVYYSRDGCGGAIYNDGFLVLTASTMASNSASGGSGGIGSPGCAVNCPGAPYPGGPGGNGGSGLGGGLFNAGTAGVVNCTFLGNTCVGGAGGAGGNGGPGIYHGTPGTAGGNGGAGGNAFGGGIYGAASLTNCTLAFNSVSPGAGGLGGQGGHGAPPGIDGQPGANGPSGSTAGGGISSGSLVNTLLATNTPGGNGSGAITDLGHNLSSDSTCNFTNVGSLNNTDPKLGPLADNGGPTLTMALLPGSPAIDAGDTAAAPTTDQRGYPRHAGAAADIGAYEYDSMLPVLGINGSGASALDILVRGNTNRPFRLWTSPNLLNWQCVTTNQIGPDGTTLFQDNCGSGDSQQFYRATMP